MLFDRMCGVVLWTSEDDGRAVIWCEDHGNLAFYTAQDTDVHVGPSLDAGDLIEFELDDAREHRVAHNPRLLVQDHAPRLAQRLRNTQGSASVSGRRRGKVLSFPGMAAA